MVKRQAQSVWCSAASAPGQGPDPGFMEAGDGNDLLLSLGGCPITRGPKLYWHRPDRHVCHLVNSEDTKQAVLFLWQGPLGLHGAVCATVVLHSSPQKYYRERVLSQSLNHRHTSKCCLNSDPFWHLANPLFTEKKMCLANNFIGVK